LERGQKTRNDGKERKEKAWPCEEEMRKNDQRKIERLPALQPVAMAASVTALHQLHAVYPVLIWWLATGAHPPTTRPWSAVAAAPGVAI
jgi:hypothetical protein